MVIRFALAAAERLFLGGGGVVAGAVEVVAAVPAARNASLSPLAPPDCCNKNMIRLLLVLKMPKPVGF